MTFEKNEIKRPSWKAFCKDISSRIQNLGFLNLYSNKVSFLLFSTLSFPWKHFLPQPDVAFFLFFFNLFLCCCCCCLLVSLFPTNTSEVGSAFFCLKNYMTFLTHLCHFWLPWLRECLLLLLISPLDCSLSNHK